MPQFQEWALSTNNQTVQDLGGTAYSMTVQELCDNYPDFKYEMCNEATGEGKLWNAALTDAELDGNFSIDGEIGGVIISGTHPTCA